jgi:hypothetical protein
MRDESKTKPQEIIPNDLCNCDWGCCPRCCNQCRYSFDDAELIYYVNDWNIDDLTIGCDITVRSVFADETNEIVFKGKLKGIADVFDNHTYYGLYISKTDKSDCKELELLNALYLYFSTESPTIKILKLSKEVFEVQLILHETNRSHTMEILPDYEFSITINDEIKKK